MILTALTRHYEHQSQRGRLPAFGLTQEKVSFALVLGREGQLQDVEDIRDTSGKKPKWTSLEVPASFKRSGVAPPPFFLWDKTGFVLGVEQKSGAGQPKLMIDAFRAFRALHAERLADATDEALLALRRFIEWWEPRNWRAFDQVVGHAPELLASNVVFRLDGAPGYLHERPAARHLIDRYSAADEGMPVTCLVSGETRPAARLHPAIKGVYGAQASGASIVSFNLDAFNSYGKERGSNAPVCSRDAFAYTTVLNQLLRRDASHRQCVQVADASVVFWARSNNEAAQLAAETFLCDALDPPFGASPEYATLCRSLSNPTLVHAPETEVALLALSPNASRLWVRYWVTGTLGDFARRLSEHFEDLSIQPAPSYSLPAAWRLFNAIAANERTESVPLGLAAATVRAVLCGTPYPRGLLSAALARMRADKRISGLRVALCKAVLSRERRMGTALFDMEIPVSLDKSNPSPGYRLGRLFSVLESIQQTALGRGLGATIRERYYGCASATPAHAFPLLMRGAQHHLSKAFRSPGNRARAQALELEAAKILDGVEAAFPHALSLNEQGCFAIGYYHQRAAIERAESTEAA
jgi:CRISPR-associated protein Csd1